MSQQTAILCEKIAAPKYKESDCQCKKQPIDMRFKKGRLHWLKQLGDTVRTGQVIALAEVEKSVIEIKAPTAGTLSEITVAENETFRYQTIIGQIKAEG